MTPIAHGVSYAAVMISQRNALRAMLPPLLSRLPAVRGRGRVTLLFDRILTDERDPRSFHVTGSLNGGFRFHFDLRPWGQKFAYYYRSWEPDAIRALRALYTGGWFVDVGSSLGLYVVCMSDVVRAAGGRIASIEPIPFNLERQAVNVALNGVADLVDTAPVAVGSAPGRVFLSVDPSHADNNAFVSTEGEMSVEVVPLDDLAARRNWSPVGAMKIDVEGYEPEVVAGARATIARDRPVVLAEFNRERMAINGFSMHESWDFFLDHQYEAYVLDHRRLRKIGEPGSHEDLFFVPRDRAIPCHMLAPPS